MDNIKIIESFYTAFQEKRADDMIALYADDVIFEDPAFGKLHGSEAKAMWKMLVERGGKELKIEFKNIKADENTAEADWIAHYKFSKTNRDVLNKIHAQFKLKDGKIYEHKDHFSMWRWSSMALGSIGYLLGFSSMVRNKVRSEALKSLKLYMQKTTNKNS